MPRIVSCTCLGQLGRFGNQLFQYAVARKYAELHGAVLETNAWVGQELFGLADPLPSRPLPRASFNRLPWGHVNIDLFGYFQFQGAVGLLRVAELREWFRFDEDVLACFRKPRPNYIAAHVRAGDYLELGSRFALVGRSSYERALAAYGFDAADVIYVSEGWCPPDPRLEARGLGFVTDFLTLMHADVLFRSNSTFSWWASVLGGPRTFSPLVEDRTGKVDADFVEGNWPRVCDGKHFGFEITDLRPHDSKLVDVLGKGLIRIVGKLANRDVVTLD